MQIPYLIKQQKGKWFLISIEVPWRAGERSQLFLLAQWAPGPLLAVSRTITAEPQKINWWLLSWDIAPGSSWGSLMHWHAWTILLNQSQLPQSGQAHRIKQTLFPFRITRLNPGPQSHLAESSPTEPPGLCCLPGDPEELSQSLWDSPGQTHTRDCSDSSAELSSFARKPLVLLSSDLQKQP